MSDWKRLGTDLAGELAWQLRRAGAAIGRVVGDPVHVAGYRGYGTSRRLLVLGRAMQQEGITPAEAGHSRLRNLYATLKRLESDPLPYARVRVRLGSTSRELVADDEGFVRDWVDLPEPLPAPGWQHVELELQGERVLRSSATVLVPPASARFGIISDIDDTVVQSEVANFLRAARIVLMENALTRLPFPGVAAFYRALHRGASGEEHNPVFYVSSSPWNLYDVISDFLAAQHIPEGPLLLRDWDLRPAMTDHQKHKLREIRSILDTYGSLPFVLIGDSTQEDPEIYAALVREYPSRILAVYIRNVRAPEARVAHIRRLAADVESAGSALVLADDTFVAAQHALARGFVAPDALQPVREERAADEGRTGDKAPSPGVETPRAPATVIDHRLPPDGATHEEA